MSLNPYVHSSHPLTLLVHAGLVEMNPRTKRLEPALARAIEESEGGKVITFTLRRGLRFSDGAPFTAKDVVFTVNQVILNEENDLEPRNWMAIGKNRYVIKRVERVDDYTVRFYLNVRMPAAFMWWLEAMPMLPAHKFADMPARHHRHTWGLDESPKNIVGLGPYAVHSIEPDRLVLTRNRFYWKRDRARTQLPYLDQVVLHSNVRFAFNKDKRLAAEPRVDILEWPQSFNAQIAPAWTELGTANRYRLYSDGPSSRTVSLALNQDASDPAVRSLFRDVRFRQALARLINKPELIAQFPFGAVPRTSTINFHSIAQRDEALPKYDYDPDGARSILASIGLVDRNGDGKLEFPDNTPVRFRLLVDSRNAIETVMARLLRTQLGQGGMEVIADDVTTDELNQRLFHTSTPNFDCAVLNDRDDQLNPILALSVLHLHLAEPSHVFRRSDGRARPEALSPAQREIMKLGILYMTEPNPFRSLGLLVEIQKIVAVDLPVLPLVAGRHVYLATEGLQNVSRLEGWAQMVFSQVPYMWWEGTP